MLHIRQELIIGAGTPAIYEALTSQAGLAAWWTPMVHTDGTAGGFARFGFAGGYFKEMEITTLQPGLMVGWRCRQGAAEWIGTRICFRLHTGGKDRLRQCYPEARDKLEQQQEGPATLLCFAHDDWQAYTPMFAECSYTWGRFLQSLKAYCATGAGVPWPGQHRLR